jgi:anti-sigma regulatory factor (Ser/Thr protein kinase)
MAMPRNLSQPAFRATYPADAQSAALARGAVRFHCANWGRKAIADGAALVVTELVANAVRHAHTDIDLHVLRTPDGVRLEVSDGSVNLPVRRKAGPLSVGGRGLWLVDMLSASSGVDARSDGKTVWAELEW